MRYTRHYNVVFAVGFGSTAGLAWLARPWIEADAAGATYPLTAAACFAALMAAIVWVAGEQHPYPRFGPANCVTTIRAVVVALLAGLIGRPAAPEVLWSAIGLTALMAALDGLDGWLARRTRMTSEFGSRFDMETDAVLILVLSVLVWQHGKAGGWVLLCGLMRYGFVAAGWVLPWLARPLRSTSRGKTVAVGQLFGLSAALAPIVPAPHAASVAAITLAALMWSFAVDVRWLSRRDRTS
ncbi:MAG: CDP-alcohol phosphatidyltransferase family protein [Acidobacteria bacterium]|nr:CDP-alcohol phosphatidyltransferase family protein [Acidobacteriota bacterium]